MLVFFAFTHNLHVVRTEKSKSSSYLSAQGPEGREREKGSERESRIPKRLMSISGLKQSEINTAACLYSVGCATIDMPPIYLVWYLVSDMACCALLPK